MRVEKMVGLSVDAMAEQRVVEMVVLKAAMLVVQKDQKMAGQMAAPMADLRVVVMVAMMVAWRVV